MKCTKLFYVIALIMVISSLMATPALAAHGITVTVNGQALQFDVPPVNIEGRTLVPLRGIFEALGVEPQWDGATQTVTAQTAATSIVLPIGSCYPTVNGVVLELDVPSTIVSGRTMVPTRFIAESLGADVVWDGFTSTVKIDSSVVREKDKFISFDGIKITVGDTQSYVEKLLGLPDRIDPSNFAFNWHIYNSDYSRFIMVGIKNGIVKGIYTNSKGFEMNGVRYGDLGVGIAYDASDIKFYIDTQENRKIHAALIGMSTWSHSYNEAIYRAEEMQNFDATNAFRVNNGLKPLKYDHVAAKTARKHSQDMAYNNYFSHTDQQGLSAWDRYLNNGGTNYYLSENISAGTSLGIAAFDRWINSEGHRRNILRDHDYLGVGFVYNGSSRYNFYMTQVFTKSRM